MGQHRITCLRNYYMKTTKFLHRFYVVPYMRSTVTWKIEHQAKAETLRFAEALTIHDGCDIKVGAVGFAASGLDLARLHQARQW